MLAVFTKRMSFHSLKKELVRSYCQKVDDYPPVRVFVKDRYRYFVDSLRITVKGGAGGNGLPRYGGTGGKGGDVYVEACDRVELKQLSAQKRRYAAEAGDHSVHYRILGTAGKDCVVKVPVGVTIISEHGRVLGQLDKVGDKVLVALGGKGGDQYSNYCGTKGQTQSIVLDLKLIADAGLVGFPNAGKSTLLKALSRASPKIANYPFTTINPNIGVMEFDDLRQISVADLPGLIEGAHKNVGLGHKFLKHIIRTKLLAFVIDVNGFQYRPDWPRRSPLETLLLLNKELELYDDTLLSKPCILLVSKIDNNQVEKKFFHFVDQLKSLHDNGLNDIQEEMKPNELIKFDEIIPICAHNAYNIPKVREVIRNVIDLNFEINKIKSNKELTFKGILSKHQALKKEDDVFLI